MAYIKVDHSKLESTASLVEAYISNTKKKMNNANGYVANMSGSWQGVDFNQFKLQWDGVTNNDSAYSQMMKSLESYAQFLRYAASKYKNAQAKAINRANSLPKW